MQLNLSPEKKEFGNTFLLVILYAGGFYALQFFLYSVLMVPFLPTEKNLIVWDAGFYKTLSQTAYIFSADPHTLASFPLFPLIWKIAHLGAWGICVLNILFLATGFSILCSLYKTSTANKILWLSIPAMYYAFIPYTEALFFLLSALTIYGIKKKKTWVIIISLFFLSLTRATAIFLAPAFLAMSLLSADRKYWYKSLFPFVTTYLLPIVLGTGVFIYHQYVNTGVWFAFFNAQRDFWGHVLNVPILPFNSYSGPPLLWISALSMFVGFFCFFFLIIRSLKWLTKNAIQDGPLIASCTYLVMVLLAVVLYGPTWGSGTTNISGIFRYSIMNPFFFIFLYHFTNVVTYTWKNFLLIFFIANIVWLSFGSYVHIQTFLYYTTDTILIFIYMLHANKKLTWPAVILTALNIFFQVQLFQQYIGVQWYPD